jgi:hypothetical protein
MIMAGPRRIPNRTEGTDSKASVLLKLPERKRSESGIDLKKFNLNF